ncbi:MAG: GGDEF domain-containing protein [Pirellulaceae bacterium]|nr:GGDEF domain-containing protein [Pirellulaceae bacterium]
MPEQMGLIGVHCSTEQTHLADYLAARGYRIERMDQGAVYNIPDVIVTDQEKLPELALAPEAQEHLGVVGVGVSQGVDVTLGSDVQGHELAVAVELVMQIVSLRRQRDQDRKESQRWYALAMYDPLTGLPNRRAWQNELTRRCGKSASLCVGLIDIDFFKRVNDSGGHDLGDAVLREVAVAMRAHLRESDFVARIGGDEFGLLLSEVAVEEAHKVVDRMRDHVFQHLGHRGMPRATTSAGCAIVDSGKSNECEDLYHAAAQSLHAAKQQSRNCTVIYREAHVNDWSSPTV